MFVRDEEFSRNSNTFHEIQPDKNYKAFLRAYTSEIVRILLYLSNVFV